MSDNDKPIRIIEARWREREAQRIAERDHLDECDGMQQMLREYGMASRVHMGRRRSNIPTVG